MQRGDVHLTQHFIHIYSMSYNRLKSTLSFIAFISALLIPCISFGQPQAAHIKAGRPSQMVRRYISPVKILWQTAGVSGAEKLLKPGNGQAELSGAQLTQFKNSSNTQASLLLDFGTELQGGLQIITGMFGNGKPAQVRIRFGESAAEAMAEIEPEHNATNDHAIRDLTTALPWLGRYEYGNTGYRFVRIDLLGENASLSIKEISATFQYRDIPYLGYFKCNDTLLNKIWETGAYTVHLNMQDFLWDGIKRDRLVWVGDMHPEVSTISAVFGDNVVVPRSLDQARDITPLPGFMNGMVSYSMWWMLIQRDWYMHTGNLAYLKEQHAYMKGLVDQLVKGIDNNNKEVLSGGGRFLDWPSSEDTVAIHAGLQALMIMSLNAGGELCKVLKDDATAQKCADAVKRLKLHNPSPGQSKQAAAMLALAGLQPAQKMNKDIISRNGVENYSTFFGYYMLQAKALAGDYDGALNDIRRYWGSMLSLGATTFWEDFNIKWLDNAERIDELPAAGKVDVHGTYGAYCYKGYRHSLCHGWASGPTAWLSQHVLGIEVTSPGYRSITIKPHLGDLTYAEGAFPTPYGVLKVSHKKQADGSVKTTYQAPKGVKVILGK